MAASAAADGHSGAATAGAGAPGGRAAVLGSPIAHSLSPVLHTAGYRELGLTGWSYEAIECDENGLAALLGSLGPDWAGLSLTMPLKRAVLPLLDDAEQLARDVGAANTVLLRDGRRLGYNTDVPGMVAALRQAGVTPGGNVLILGGGATACSALAALREIGASDIAVAVRSRQKAGPLRGVAARLGLDVRLLELGAAVADIAGPGAGADDAGADDAGGDDAGGDGLAGADVGGAGGGADVGGADGGGADLGCARWGLLISTVPAAGAAAFASQLKAGAVRADVVFDVVYDPWPTALAEAADAAGLRVISGYELLVNQAVGQFELMTGRPAPVAAMRTAGLAELARRRNIRSG